MLKSKDLYVLKWERQQRFRPGSQDLFLVASTGELLKVPTKVSKISDSNAVFQAIFKQRRPLVIFPQLPGQLPLHVFESRCSWACVFLFWACNVHGKILELETTLKLRVGCWGLRMLGRFETYISIAVTAKLEDGRDSSDPHSLRCVSAGRRQARGAQIHFDVLKCGGSPVSEIHCGRDTVFHLKRRVRPTSHCDSNDISFVQVLRVQAQEMIKGPSAAELEFSWWFFSPSDLSLHPSAQIYLFFFIQ